MAAVTLRHLLTDYDISNNELRQLPLDLTSSFEIIGASFVSASTMSAILGSGFAIGNCMGALSVPWCFPVTLIVGGGCFSSASMATLTDPPKDLNFDDQLAKLHLLAERLNQIELPENINCILPEGKMYLKEESIQNALAKCHKYRLIGTTYCHHLAILLEDRLSDPQKSQLEDATSQRHFFRTKILGEMHSEPLIHIPE